MNLSESLCLKRLFGKWLVVWSRQKTETTTTTKKHQARTVQTVSQPIYTRTENRLNIKPLHQPVSQHSHRKPFWVYHIQAVTPFLQESVQTNKRGQCCVLVTHSLSNLLLFPQNFFTYYGEGSFNFFGLFLTVTLFCHLSQSERLCS